MKRNTLIIAAIFASIVAVTLIFQVKKPDQPTDIKPLELSLDISSDTGYLASPPDFGPLIKTQTIKVTFSGDTATGVLPSSDATRIKTNKPVILYDKDGFTLPLGGKVSTVEQTDDSHTITIALPDQTNTDLLLDELDIITMETIASKRLPKSVYQQDDEGGSYYVWRALPTVESPDIYTLEKLPIEIGLQSHDYFEEGGYKIQSSDLIILNPDQELTADKAYHLKIVDLELHIHNPIKQAWVDFEMNRLSAQQDKLREAAENCGKSQSQNVDTGTQTLPPTNNSTRDSDSCGGGIDFSGSDPVDIFNSLINTPM